MKDKFWEYFDDESRAYVETIMDAESDYYEKAAAFINPCLRPNSVALDIGNGGIINYNYEELDKLVCADISVSKKVEEVYKHVPNVEFIESNIINMNNIKEESFDYVIVQKVIHHLAEINYVQTKKNCEAALLECERVLKKGGYLIICESTVKRWFEILEIVFFKPMLMICDLIKFDRVYQYSPKSLENVIQSTLCERMELQEISDIGAGQHILFLGHKFPSWILPCSVTFYKARKI